MVASYAWAAPEGILSGTRDLLGALGAWPLQVQQARQGQAAGARADRQLALQEETAKSDAERARAQLDAYLLQNYISAANSGVALDPQFEDAAAMSRRRQQATVGAAEAEAQALPYMTLLKMLQAGQPVPLAQQTRAEQDASLLGHKPTRPIATTPEGRALLEQYGGAAGVPIPQAPAAPDPQREALRQELLRALRQGQ
jgi:hypothetical protein